MRVNLFDIDNKGAAKIPKPIKEIWYLKAILDKYGEEKALKLFQIFDKCYNLNPNENPFANLTEDTKFETVLRSTYPELEHEIDMEDDLIQQALDLVGELYETNKYRAYKAIKIAYEKIVKQLQYTHISLSKEDGNMAEINKALAAFEDLNKKQNSAYKELEDEMQVKQVKGGGVARRRPQQELE